MHRAMILGLILLATVLEASGDAAVRVALGSGSIVPRLALFALGGALLFGYGFSLVSAPLDFGRLFGVYIAILFIVSQITNAVVFRAMPTLPICVGGALIIVGGMIVTCWKVRLS